MNPLMNDTKWDELRLAMYRLDTSPKWRTKMLGSGFVSTWDGEWFYHFKAGRYSDIEWVEIRVTSEVQKQEVLAELRRIHVPGHETEDGFRVYGHASSAQSSEYI